MAVMEKEKILPFIGFIAGTLTLIAALVFEVLPHKHDHHFDGDGHDHKQHQSDTTTPKSTPK